MGAREVTILEPRRWQIGELVEFADAAPVRKVILALDGVRSALLCLKGGQELGAHPAPGHALVQVLSGRVRFGIEEGEEVVVGRGAYFYLPPGCRHRVRAVKDSVLLVVVAGAAPGY